MEIVLSLVLCVSLVIIFYFTGLIINKFTNIAEDENKLLKFLICFSFGASVFLIISNLFGNVTKNFNTTLIIIGLIIAGLIIWQIKDFKELCNSLKYFFQVDNLKNWLHERTNKYFWGFLLITNIIYLLIAFSSTKIGHYGVGSSYASRIDQLVSGDYPPVDYCRQNLNVVFNFGSEILAGTISKFTKSSPEISLDVLTFLFLNLSFLALYGLSIKFLSGKIPLAKYMVLLAAFFAWGPITQLFTQKTSEMTGLNLPEKINFLTQSKLINIAEPTGLFIHWFFLPSMSIGIFFLIISLYLIFLLFEGKRNLNYSILLGLFLSTFFIIDLSLFLILLFGIIIYLIFSSIPETDKYKIDNKNELYKYLGITFLVAIIFGFINTNLFQIITTKGFFDINSSYINEKYGPITSNTLLFAVYCFGFYLAFRSNEKWIAFLAYFFLGTLIAPLFLNIPGAPSGKILMSGNFLAAFSMPLVMDFIIKRFSFKNMEIKIFYTLAALIFCSNSLMFFAFGDTEKPVFKIVNKSIKYNGLQAIPSSETQEVSTEFQNDLIFTKYLKTKKTRGEIILTERPYVEIFSKRTKLCSLLPLANPPSHENKLLFDEYEKAEKEYRTSFSLDGKYWSEKRIQWIYLTPKLFRYMLSPQARNRFLNAYFKNGVKLELGNKAADSPIILKELYSVNPKHLKAKPDENFSDKLAKFLKSPDNSPDAPLYLKQIAACPYFGIYSAKSNDFDGDKIADLAFFNQAKKSWVVIYGKNQQESEFDLSGEILSFNYTDIDLLIPIPADYDGDLKTDIALFNRTNGSWHVVKSSDSQVDKRMASIIWSRPSGEIPTPADVDGDSKVDISCFDSIQNGAWHNYLTTTNSYFAHGFEYSVLDIPAHVDVDGDKKADYVVYRPGQRSFFVYLSSRSFSREKPIQVNIGELNSRIVPEDYDGDGKVDLATWEPETGKWEIAFAKDFLSGLSYNASYSFLLGKAGDIPMPADYNGDGKADAAVYLVDSSELKISFRDGTSKKINLSKFKNYIPASFIGI